MEIRISKQSLKDWRVIANGSHVCWIEKVRLGYEVVPPGMGNYFFPKFSEARKFAIGLANYEVLA